MKKQNQTLQLTLAGILCGVAVVGSTISFPVFASKCAPVQHMVNVFAGVALGPWYALSMAFCASLLRNLLGLGSLLAFPGSMCGALLCGLLWRRTGRLYAAVIGEIIGTGLIGGLMAYPIAVTFMGGSAGTVAFYAYVVPFLVSTAVGACVSSLILTAMTRSGLLRKLH